MGWSVLTVSRSEKTSKILVFLHSGRSKLIAATSSEPGGTADGFENRLVSAFSDPKTGEWDEQREQGRKMIAEAVESAEDKGLFRQADLRVDSVLHIHSQDKGGEGPISAELVHERDSYSTFCSMLKPSNKIVASAKNHDQGQDGGDGDSDVRLRNDMAPYADILYEKSLPSWRKTSTKAGLASSPGDEFVYKGISFFLFLVCGADDFAFEVEACYREIQMVNHIIPPHPNIIAPARYLVYVESGRDGEETGPSSERLVCGSLYVFYTGGSLADLLDRSVRGKKTRFPPALKAKWCYQLCLAMCHVHFEARNWHQDLKPPNVLLDDDQNILVVDWEQCGANPFVLAPEADGTLDVRELDDEVSTGRRRLAYSRYKGPERINQAVEPRWNVFHDWSPNHPRAAELAEVFSLGRTMWVLLEQVGLENQPGVTDYSTQTIHWSSWSDDIPASWKRIVEASMADDPNNRPLMSELLDFWKKEWERLK